MDSVERAGRILLPEEDEHQRAELATWEGAGERRSDLPGERGEGLIGRPLQFLQPLTCFANQRNVVSVEHWQDYKTGQPKHLGDLWSLRKKGRTALCILVGHPLGSEARVIVDGDLVRSEHFKDTKQMLDTTEEWRKAFEQKGWRSLPGKAGG